MRVIRTATTVLGVLLTVGACGRGAVTSTPSTSSASSTPTALSTLTNSAPTPPRHVASWRQPGTSPERLTAAVGPDRVRLIESDGDRQAFLDTVGAGGPDAPAAVAVRAVDLRSAVLVVGSYGDCQTVNQVEVRRSTAWFVAKQPDNINCVWSPLTVAVWQVARSGLGSPPYDVRAGSPTGG